MITIPIWINSFLEFGVGWEEKASDSKIKAALRLTMGKLLWNFVIICGQEKENRKKVLEICFQLAAELRLCSKISDQTLLKWKWNCENFFIEGLYREMFIALLPKIFVHHRIVCCNPVAAVEISSFNNFETNECELAASLNFMWRLENHGAESRHDWTGVGKQTRHQESH